MTEEILRTRLLATLTETYLRETLNDASGEDDRGRSYTDLASAAASMADWLAQEIADPDPVAAVPGPDGSHQ